MSGVHKETIEKALQAADLYREGYNAKEIAEFTESTRSSVYRLLKIATSLQDEQKIKKGKKISYKELDFLGRLIRNHGSFVDTGGELGYSFPRRVAFRKYKSLCEKFPLLEGIAEEAHNYAVEQGIPLKKYLRVRAYRAYYLMELSLDPDDVADIVGLGRDHIWEEVRNASTMDPNLDADKLLKKVKDKRWLDDYLGSDREQNDKAVFDVFIKTGDSNKAVKVSRYSDRTNIYYQLHNYVKAHPEFKEKLDKELAKQHEKIIESAGFKAWTDERAINEWKDLVGTKKLSTAIYKKLRKVRKNNPELLKQHGIGYNEKTGKYYLIKK